jgi:dCMP deaminase
MVKVSDTLNMINVQLKSCKCTLMHEPHHHVGDMIIPLSGYIQEGTLIMADQIDKVIPHRPDWRTYWLGILDKVAERSTCDRGMIGAILIDDDQQIIATGYAGAPKGLSHCSEAGHLIRKVTYEDGSVHEHCVRTAHAERNAIVQAAKRGVSVKGATLYCTMEPCLSCATDIINAGIRKVIAKNGYHGAALTRKWFNAAGVELVTINPEPIKY